jgi:addiction module RelE/StbE family toxin
MIEVSFSASFKKSFKKKIKNDSNFENKFWEKLNIFLNDPFERSLKTHKLSGQLKDLWSFSIEFDIRVIFFFVNNSKVVFIDIGTHKEVY